MFIQTTLLQWKNCGRDWTIRRHPEFVDCTWQKLSEQSVEETAAFKDVDIENSEELLASHTEELSTEEMFQLEAYGSSEKEKKKMMSQ